MSIQEQWSCVVFGIVVSLLVTSCDNGPGQNARLSGQVHLVGTTRDPSGIVLSDSTIADADGIPVHLQSQARAAPDVVATSSGRYEFLALEPGTYRATSGVVSTSPESTGWVALSGEDTEFPEILELRSIGVGDGGPLRGCAPNPLAPTTRCHFDVADSGHVTMVVKDLTLSTVRTLVDGDLPPGLHVTVWNGVDDGGQSVPAGPYWVCLTIDGEAYADLVLKP